MNGLLPYKNVDIKFSAFNAFLVRSISKYW